MGWASGSRVMSEIIGRLAKDFVGEPETRKKIYLAVIPALEEADWDTHEDCYGSDPMYSEALRELHPDWDWGEEAKPTAAPVSAGEGWG